MLFFWLSWTNQFVLGILTKLTLAQFSKLAFAGRKIILLCLTKQVKMCCLNRQNCFYTFPVFCVVCWRRQIIRIIVIPYSSNPEQRKWCRSFSRRSFESLESWTLVGQELLLMCSTFLQNMTPLIMETFFHVNICTAWARETFTCKQRWVVWGGSESFMEL